MLSHSALSAKLEAWGRMPWPDKAQGELLIAAAERIQELEQALNQCVNACEGRYPWFVYKRFSQKEAREVAARLGNQVLAKREDPKC